MKFFKMNCFFYAVFKYKVYNSLAKIDEASITETNFPSFIYTNASCRFFCSKNIMCYHHNSGPVFG